MDAALNHPDMIAAANIYLDAWEHNIRAQKFYSRSGFDVIGAHVFEVESAAETRNSSSCKSLGDFERFADIT